jgi:hypothetical protein
VQPEILSLDNMPLAVVHYTFLNESSKLFNIKGQPICDREKRQHLKKKKNKQGYHSKSFNLKNRVRL